MDEHPRPSRAWTGHPARARRIPIQFLLVKGSLVFHNAPQPMQRLLTDEEAAQARAMINWTFWAPPAIFALACIGAVFFLIGADMVAWAVFAPFVVITAVMWFSRLRQHGKVVADIDRRIVEVMDGAPERVWMSRGGACYVRLAGQNIQVPNDHYSELREANRIRVAILPTARIAVHIESARGIGLA